jgi:parvulin-like peptidyl-prolyl isomerase
MFRNLFIASMFVSAVLCLTASAQQDKPAPPATPQTPAQPAPQPQAPVAESTESNVVVTRVSGEPITEKQILSAIQALAAQKIALTPDQEKQKNTILFKGALENLITTTVLKSQARKLNVTVDKAKVDQQMQQFAGRFPSPDEFQKAMAKQGLTEAEVRKNVEESLSMQELLDRAVKDVPEATDADIQKFYEVNQEKFRTAERAHIAQIFLKADPNSTPEQRVEIKSKLDAIRADIDSKNITFADAAAKYSQDPNTASKGGDLGFLSRGGKAKAVEDIVFGTTPGGMTPVIEDQSGCRLVQVIELKPAGAVSLEMAKPAIKQLLDQNAKQTAVQK